MASASDAAQLSPKLALWVGDEIVKDFVEVERLSREEDDPSEEPYRSLYAARELLNSLQIKLKSCPVRDSGEDYTIISSCLQLHLALNYLNTEEPTRGVELLEECIQKVEVITSKVKTASLCVEVYNQLGIAWSNWDEQQKSLEYLLKSKAVYESHIALPPPVTHTQWLAGRDESEEDRERTFETLHTHTLFYLAQVFGHLNQPKQSALYCQQTLCRQIEMKEYDAVEWSVSCATLSQYYINIGHYRQARHCLAAATHILQRFSDEGSGLERDGMREKMIQAESDVARCWTKYCTSLLQTSRDKLDNPNTQEEKKPQKYFRFESLELADLESEISAELVKDCETAKTVFVFAQRKIEESKRFYSLDELASGYVEVIQDHSLMYKLLVSFETELVNKCRLQKRRIDILSATLTELNPQHYLSVCRQLMYELAECNGELASLKIVQGSEAPSVHAVMKINKLIHSAINHFQRFIDTFKESSSGELPAKIEPDLLRPILSAQLACGRLYTQIINSTKTEQVACLKKALGQYQWLIDYHAHHTSEVNDVFEEEVKVCKEMAELLPIRIATFSKQ